MLAIVQAPFLVCLDYRNKNLEKPKYWVPYYWMALIEANDNRIVESKKLLLKEPMLAGSRVAFTI